MIRYFDTKCFLSKELRHSGRALGTCHNWTAKSLLSNDEHKVLKSKEELVLKTLGSAVACSRFK